jgi:leader peptidase (prepilin peptidase) / N-methyltransferase
VLTTGWTALAAALTGLVMAVSTRSVLSALPEPVDAPGKVSYRRLARPGFAVLSAVVSAAAVAGSLAVVPAGARPAWAVVGTCGVLLALIDASTTWLPLPLSQASWLLMALAILLGWPLSGDWRLALRALAGAAIAGALYLMVWLVTRGGFGFGDVRFAPLLGAASAACSWQVLVWALTLGTLAGGVQGLVRLIARRPGAFPYAPAMLAGSYLAVLVDSLGG